MQTGQRIWKDCADCLGTGKMYHRDEYNNDDLFAFLSAPPIGHTEVVCPHCNGLGVIPWGWLRDEKEDTMPGEEA